MSGFRSETQAGVRGAFMGIGKVVGGAIGAVAVGEIVKSSVSAASEIQKQLEVIRFEFGRASGGLIKFADTAGIALGDSNRATDIASARFGLLFKSLGIGQKQAAGMTLGFEKLALSVNAIRGGGAQGASTLLQSIVLAAAGNTRGLKQMGIVVDATSEKIAAFKLGLISSMTQALTPAQKTEAIYAIATAHLGQTMALAKAHAGDLANVQARLSAEFMLAKERLGNALLPAMARLVGFLADKLPAATNVLAGILKDVRVEFEAAFGFVKPLFEPLVRIVRAVIDAFKGGGGLGGALERLRADFAKLSPSAKIAIAALGGIAAAFAAIVITSFPITSIVVLGAALAEAYRRSARFRDIVAQIGGFIRAKIVPAFQALGKALAPVAAFIVNTVGRAGEAIVRFFRSGSTASKIALAVIGGALFGIVGLLGILAAKFPAVRAAFTSAFAVIRAGVTFLIPIFQGLGRALVYTFHRALPVIRNLGSTIKVVFTDVLPILRTFARIVGGVVVGAVRVLQAVWRHFGHTFIAIAKATLGTVIGVIKGGLEVVRGIFDFITGLLTLNWRKAWKGITEILGGSLHAALSGVKNWGHVLVAFFTDLWHTIEKIVLTGIEKVVHLLAKIPTGFSVFGHHFGFTNPFQGWDKSLQSTISNIGKSGKEAVKQAAAVSTGVKHGLAATGNDPGTKNVAKQTGTKIGTAVGQGAAQGIAKAAPAMQKTLSDTLQRAIQAANTKVASTVQSAKNNLDKIGQDLAKTITGIQSKLGGAAGALAGSPQGKAFQKLKKLIESGAPAFEIQRAQSALSSQLQNVGKTTPGGGAASKLGTQLANLTAEFNKGQIGYKTFQKRLHLILSKDGVTMAQALKAAGPAVADQLKAEIRAMAAQAKAIAAIPRRFRGVGGAGGGSDIKIVRPLEVIKAEGLRLRVITQKAHAQAKAAAAKQQALQRSFNQVQIAGVGATRHGTRATQTVRDAVRASTSATGRNAARAVRDSVHAAKQRATSLVESKKHTVLLMKIAGERVAATRHRQVVRAHQATTTAVQAHHRTARERPRETRQAQTGSLLLAISKASLAAARVAARTARLHPKTPILRPILRPVFRPVFRSVVRPVIHPPAVRPLIRNVVRPVTLVRPILRPILRPVLAPVARPILRPVTLVRPVIRPVFRPAIRVLAPNTGDGRLAALLQAGVDRLLLPLNALRLDGLRVQQALATERVDMVRAILNLQARLVTQDRALLAAELRVAHPIQGLRSDQARIAANAAAQRDRLLRSSERSNALLRRLDRKHHGPQPGHGKTPYGAGSHSARQHAMTGGR